MESVPAVCPAIVRQAIAWNIPRVPPTTTDKLIWFSCRRIQFSSRCHADTDEMEDGKQVQMVRINLALVAG
jgi:hypothetical protein